MAERVEFDPAVEEATFRIAATDNASTLLAALVCREVMPLARKVLVDSTVFRPEVFEDLASGRLQWSFDGLNYTGHRHHRCAGLPNHVDGDESE
jgi:hypothetical protein